MPACGISLGLERILVVMGERDMFPPALAGRCRGRDGDHLECGYARRMRSASQAELRAAGLRVDVYPEPDKLGKQFKYADARGVRFVAIVGDDEAARGEVAIKNLRTASRLAAARTQVAEFVGTLRVSASTRADTANRGQRNS